MEKNVTTEEMPESPLPAVRSVIGLKSRISYFVKIRLETLIKGIKKRCENRLVNWEIKMTETQKDKVKYC